MLAEFFKLLLKYDKEDRLFILNFTKFLIDTGIGLGFTKKQARILSIQTVIGSIELVNKGVKI